MRTSAMAGIGLVVGAVIGCGTLATRCEAAAPVVQRIGKEALIEMPDAAMWSGVVNFRPGNGEVVHVNPPAFSWLYTEDDPRGYRDMKLKRFQFQVAYDKDFNELAVDVRTESNMYNFLAPFKKKACWWRVGYIDPKKVNPVEHWSKARAFTIAADAKDWDRSMLADEKYLQVKAVHPRVLFTRETREALSKHVQAKETETWAWARAYADRAIASDWWKQGDVEYKDKNVLGKAEDLALVAFVWQMTKDPRYQDNLTPKPQELLVKVAKSYVDTGAAFEDVISQRPGIAAIGKAYDWLYEVMTPEQRKAVAAQMSIHFKWAVLNGHFQYHYPTTPETDDWGRGIYSEDRVRGFLVTYGESHEYCGLGESMVGALAAYSEDDWARRLLDLGLNAIIGRPLFIADSEEGVEGGGYFAPYVELVLYRSMYCQIVFPEAQFNRNPWFRTTSDWLSRMVRVGCESELYPWGDSCYGMGSYWTWFGQSLACFGKDARALKHYREQLKCYPEGPQGLDKHLLMARMFHFPEPAQEEDTQPLARAFPIGGWATAASRPPNTPEAFLDGIGFVFCCRPSGLAMSHRAMCDLSFELWAYGQTITENGCANWAYNKVSQAHTALMVDGVGPTALAGTLPYYGRIFAFSHTTDVTYAAGEGVRLFPGETAQSLKKVNRHIVMVRNRFFVIFDDMEATRPARFSFLYPVLDTLTMDPALPGTFSYTKTRSPLKLKEGYKYPGKPVTVHVSHIANRADLEVKDLTGDARFTNPITGSAFLPSASEEMKVLANPEMSDARKHALWITNKTPKERIHFMTVIYPVRPVSSEQPQIKRLDDLTVEVTCGADKDVVSFDPKTTHPATLLVDLPAMEPLPVKE